MELNESFGMWLKRRRRALDMTQGALAECAGCSLVTIRKFEGDERRPSRQLAERLADCLAVAKEERDPFIAFARQPETALVPVGPPGPLPATPLPAPAAFAPLPPPPLTDAPPPVVLPAPLTGLVGREADIDAASDLLLRSTARLVTLTGPGGTGKTRLAIEVARRLARDHPDAFADGIFFIDLSPIGDARLFLSALADALGVGDGGQSEPLVGLREFLRNRHMLLVLDNFEQIVDAAKELAELLQFAGGVSALVTSRTALRIYGEHEFPVAPLALPNEPESISLTALRSYPAIALFVDRSRAVRPGFDLTQENAADVARICERLDGLPLAIELAAARSKMLAPSALLSQLANSLDLAARQRPISDRQQTMRGTIDWSYRLLSSDEQQLFRVLGVFQGAFGLEEVRAVAAASLSDDDFFILDLLGGLVEKSMIRPVEGTEEPRFRLLYVLRIYALEQLASQGETDRYRAAHLDFFLKLAKAQGPMLILPDNKAAKVTLMAANDDFRAAMSWAFERPDRADQGLELAIALADFWKLRSMMNEGRRWLTDGLSILPAGANECRAKALVVCARLANYEAHFAESARYGREALALFQEMGDAADEEWLLMTYHILGNSLADVGDFDESLDYHHRLLQIHRRRQNTTGTQQIIRAIALTSVDMGKFDEAAEILQEAINLNRQVGGWVDDRFLHLNAAGVIELVRGQLSAARPLFEEALAVARQLDIPMWQAMILNNLGHLEIPLGNHEAARRFFVEAKQLAVDINGRNYLFQSALGEATLALLENQPFDITWPLVQECLAYFRELGAGTKRFLRLSDVLALFAAQNAHPDLAVQLVSRAEALREQKHSQPRFANVQLVYERTMTLARQQLNQDELFVAAQQGRQWPEASLLDRVEAAGAAIATPPPTVR